MTLYHRPILLLTVGAIAGVVLAAAGLVSSGRGAGGSVPSGAVAQVNGAPIRSEDYQRVLNLLAQDRRDGVDGGQRQHVLDRLIDEELLVQRALELGMARRDSKVRKDLTTAVIDSVVAEVQDTQPNERELQAFYEEHRPFFSGPGRVRVRQIFCRAPTDADAPAVLDRAQQASRRLGAGEEFTVVRGALGDTELPALPDTLLPPAKLVDYLGPTAARAALALEVGGVSDPVRSGTGFHVLQVVDRQADVTPRFDEIKSQVVAEFRRRAGEGALRTYLDELRARAQIEVAPTLP
jgi:parvulin-like peptidyl-prolyl isomerase